MIKKLIFVNVTIVLAAACVSPEPTNIYVLNGPGGGKSTSVTSSMGGENVGGSGVGGENPGPTSGGAGGEGSTGGAGGQECQSDPDPLPCGDKDDCGNLVEWQNHNFCVSDVPSNMRNCTNQICVCEDGYGDCDGDIENGCETEMKTSQRCGSCNPCPSTYECQKCFLETGETYNCQPIGYQNPESVCETI